MGSGWFCVHKLSMFIYLSLVIKHFYLSWITKKALISSNEIIAYSCFIISVAKPWTLNYQIPRPVFKNIPRKPWWKIFKFLFIINQAWFTQVSDWIFYYFKTLFPKTIFLSKFKENVKVTRNFEICVYFW